MHTRRYPYLILTRTIACTGAIFPCFCYVGNAQQLIAYDNNDLQMFFAPIKIIVNK
jgi:hypothetical protein